MLHVVDGSDDEPEEQLTAVRAVLADIGAQHVPEIVVVNKADAADPLVLGRLLRREPHAIVVSARRPARASTSCSRSSRPTLPHAAVAIDLVVPYSRGDLVARAHREGELETSSTSRPARASSAGSTSRSRATCKQRAP